MIRVDSTAYIWMGNPGNSINPNMVTQTAFEYTSTRSIFTMNVGGKVEMNITFLSPITPSDPQRQSLIFTYLDVGVQSLDGAEHDVQIYTDISAGEYCHLIELLVSNTFYRMGLRRPYSCGPMGLRYHR